MSGGGAGRTSSRTITLAVLGLTLVGTPMLAYVWETLNRVLSGDFEGVRFMWTLAIGVVFWLYLRWVGRLVERWHRDPETERGA